MPRPGVVVRIGGFKGMPAVNKDQTQRSNPFASRQGGRTNDRNNAVFEFSPLESLAKLAEGIDITGLSIKQFGIKIFFSGLLLLRSPVVIDGKKNAAIFLATGSQVDGRFAAIAADFQTRPQSSGL